jgi:hypothetical protein
MAAKLQKKCSTPKKNPSNQEKKMPITCKRQKKFLTLSRQVPLWGGSACVDKSPIRKIVI